MNNKLEKFNKNLKNKKVLILGIGVSNLPLLDYLYEHNSIITIRDKKKLEELNNEVVEKINKYNIEYVLGDNYLDDLTEYDIIFRSPSILPNIKPLEAAKEKGALITTEIEQVITLAPCKVIGITGSKGKTTTTTILSTILEKLNYNVHVGGNIGTPLFNKIKDMKKDDIIVLEMSSFQLMNMNVSPNISVITNISPDHLDIHSSYEEYIDAKKYIFKNQNKKDIVVLNEEDDIVKNMSKDTISEVRYFGSINHHNNYYIEDKNIYFNNELVIDTSKLLLKGRHNHLNICAALNAIKDYINVDNNKLESIVSSIKSVHHRLEYVRTINKVDWYNDSASTTPDKSMGGINAFDEKIVLIAGGYDKNISYEDFGKPIVENCSKLILFGATKDKIYNSVIKQKTNIEIYKLNTLEEVVNKAYEVAEPGEVVLFSPASASFDMFKNAYQRGDLFKELVNKL